MVYPKATEVFPLADYKLRVKFDNGEEKIFDVKTNHSYIDGRNPREISI